MARNIDQYQLENNFILLKNGGKDIDTIKKELKGVSSSLIEQWDEEYEKKKSEMNTDSPIHTHILAKDRGGKYVRRNTFRFNASVKDKMRIDLLPYTSINLDEAKEKGFDINMVKRLSEGSKEALNIIDQHIVNIRINEKQEGTETLINFSCDLKEDAPEIKNKVNQAIEFYLDNLYVPEKRLSNTYLIQESSSYQYAIATDIMPVSLKTFKVKKYHGIEDLELNEIPVDSKWIFITGENGFGKTVLLQALTIGLFGHKDGDRILVDLETDARISVEYKSGNESFVNHFLENKHPLKKIACYGPSRLSITSRFTTEDDESLISATNNLFSLQSPLLSIENDLIIWKLDNPERFELIKNLFKSIIPYLDNIAVSKNKKLILYTEKQIGTRGKYEPVSFNKLASGFKSLIAMVGDMILRFYQYQPEVQDPKDFEGIVLIDELDLHTHPKLQMQLPSLLSKAFPKVQFIASTHSAVPLLGAPKQSAILKVTRNKKDGIKAEKLDVDVKSLTPNLILTSPIFDMDKLSSSNSEKLADVRTEDTYEEMKENDKVDKILDEYQESDQKYPDHLFQ